MKTYRSLLFIIIPFAFFSCHQEHRITSNGCPGINYMIDEYYHHYFEYPKSLDSLIIAMESRRQNTDSSFLPCYEMTLNNLKKDKRRIQWYLTEDDFLNEELLVLKGADTIAHRVNTMRFPCLGLLLEGFKDCYFDYPITLQELLGYSKAIGYVKEEPFKGCDSVTIYNLLNSQKKGLLKWEKDENGLLVLVNNDTVTDLPPYSPCELSPFEKKRIRFYSNSKSIILSNQMETEFMRGIYSIQMEFPVVYEEEKGNYHLLHYRNDFGIELYCENDYLPPDTLWFGTMNRFVRQFAIDNNLGEILFGVVYCSKK